MKGIRRKGRADLDTGIHEKCGIEGGQADHVEGALCLNTLGLYEAGSRYGDGSLESREAGHIQVIRDIEGVRYIDGA